MKLFRNAIANVRAALERRGRALVLPPSPEALALEAVNPLRGIGVSGAQWLGGLLGWPILVENSSTAVAFLFSAFVGMFFGFYPAWRASKLNPIDCLRYE